MSSAPTPTPPSPPGPDRAASFLTQQTAVVLPAAVVIGLVVGGLTYLSGRSAAGAVLAGVLSAGGSVPVLRTLIG
ncbi:hypothetical protein ACFC00_20745 [Streptomyces adustus]|uniref:hypothetical protein n=1 Tax=Streptomyces adustus TaxID=1609272 RepID=UPI0035D52F9F